MRLSESQKNAIRFLYREENDSPGSYHYIPYTYLFDLIPLYKKGFFDQQGFGCYKIKQDKWSELLNLADIKGKT